MNLKSFCFIVCLFSSATALQAVTFNNIAVRQRWPWSQNVDIIYTLGGDTAEHINLAVYSNDTKLNIPAGALSGDLWNVAPGGPYTITFDPTKTAYTNQVLTNIRVKLTAEEAPLYMILNLTKSVADTNQITFVRAYDLTNSASAYGSWTMGSVFHTGTYLDTAWRDTPVWTAVSNQVVYKYSSILFRYIPKGTFTMGSPTDELHHAANETQHRVTLTKPFYAAVFETTRQQYLLLTGIQLGGSNGNAYPAANISWSMLRGTNTVAAYDWPTAKGIATNSAIALARLTTGLPVDLPTETQWEYACRAGTTSSWNNGTTISGDETNDDQLALLGWYSGNDTVGGTVSGPHTIHYGGLKLPNGWGLYDMHGNMYEWVLDHVHVAGTSEEATDPESQPGVNGSRQIRGGAFNYGAHTCRSASVGGDQPNRIDYRWGFRLFMTL